MTNKQKKWIDSADYEALLRRWRFAPSEDAMFQGETGEYYRKVMAKRAAGLDPAARVNASKSIGW